MTTRTKNEKYLSRPEVCARYGISRWTLRNWIKNDPTFPVPLVLNKRDYWSDYDLAKWEAARGGLDPDLEGRLIGLKPVSGVITDYQQLVDALIKRREELKVSSIELDARSGMQEGYTSKLENFGRPQGRGMGPEIFPLWLGGLKCGVVLVDLPRRPRKETAMKNPVVPPAVPPSDCLLAIKKLLEQGTPRQQLDAAKYLDGLLKETA